MKRKVLSVLLCVMMTAVLAAGCGSDNKDDGKKDGGAKTEDAKDGDVNGDGKIICGYIS